MAVRVTPRAARNRLRGAAVDADGSAVLRLAVTSPPVDGAANAAAIGMVAKAWGLAKNRITIAAGAGGRRKVLYVEGDPDALLESLTEWLAKVESDR